MAAEEGNTYAEGNEGGAPSKHKTEYNDQARKLCLLGATDKDLAEFFDVCERTINNWKDEHEEFLQSIRAGKKVADMEVASRLYETTGDRIVVEKKPFKLKKVYYNDEGKRCEEETIEYGEEERTIPADHRSISLWLRNRQSKDWKDSQQIDHTNNGGEFPAVPPSIIVEKPSETNE